MSDYYMKECSVVLTKLSHAEVVKYTGSFQVTKVPFAIKSYRRSEFPKYNFKHRTRINSLFEDYKRSRQKFFKKKSSHHQRRTILLENKYFYQKSKHASSDQAEDECGPSFLGLPLEKSPPNSPDPYCGNTDTLLHNNPTMAKDTHKNKTKFRLKKAKKRRTPILDSDSDLDDFNLSPLGKRSCDKNASKKTDNAEQNITSEAYSTSNCQISSKVAKSDVVTSERKSSTAIEPSDENQFDVVSQIIHEMNNSKIRPKKKNSNISNNKVDTYKDMNKTCKLSLNKRRPSHLVLNKKFSRASSLEKADTIILEAVNNLVDNVCGTKPTEICDSVSSEQFASPISSECSRYSLKKCKWCLTEFEGRNRDIFCKICRDVNIKSKRDAPEYTCSTKKKKGKLKRGRKCKSASKAKNSNMFGQVLKKLSKYDKQRFFYKSNSEKSMDNQEKEQPLKKLTVKKVRIQSVKKGADQNNQECYVFNSEFKEKTKNTETNPDVKSDSDKLAKPNGTKASKSSKDNDNSPHNGKHQRMTLKRKSKIEERGMTKVKVKDGVYEYELQMSDEELDLESGPVETNRSAETKKTPNKATSPVKRTKRKQQFVIDRTNVLNQANGDQLKSYLLAPGPVTQQAELKASFCHQQNQSPVTSVDNSMKEILHLQNPFSDSMNNSLILQPITTMLATIPLINNQSVPDLSLRSNVCISNLQPPTLEPRQQITISSVPAGIVLTQSSSMANMSGNPNCNLQQNYNILNTTQALSANIYGLHNPILNQMLGDTVTQQSQCNVKLNQHASLPTLNDASKKFDNLGQNYTISNFDMPVLPNETLTFPPGALNRDANANNQNTTSMLGISSPTLEGNLKLINIKKELHDQDDENLSMPQKHGQTDNVNFNNGSTESNSSEHVFQKPIEMSEVVNAAILELEAISILGVLDLDANFSQNLSNIYDKEFNEYTKLKSTDILSGTYNNSEILYQKLRSQETRIKTLTVAKKMLESYGTFIKVAESIIGVECSTTKEPPPSNTRSVIVGPMSGILKPEKKRQSCQFAESEPDLRSPLSEPPISPLVNVKLEKMGFDSNNCSSDAQGKNVNHIEKLESQLSSINSASLQYSPMPDPSSFLPNIPAVPFANQVPMPVAPRNEVVNEARQTPSTGSGSRTPSRPESARSHFDEHAMTAAEIKKEKVESANAISNCKPEKDSETRSSCSFSSNLEEPPVNNYTEVPRTNMSVLQQQVPGSTRLQQDAGMNHPQNHQAMYQQTNQVPPVANNYQPMNQVTMQPVANNYQVQQQPTGISTQQMHMLAQHASNQQRTLQQPAAQNMQQPTASNLQQLQAILSSKHLQRNTNMHQMQTSVNTSPSNAPQYPRNPYLTTNQRVIPPPNRTVPFNGRPANVVFNFNTRPFQQAGTPQSNNKFVMRNDGSFINVQQVVLPTAAMNHHHQQRQQQNSVIVNQSSPSYNTNNNYVLQQQQQSPSNPAMYNSGMVANAQQNVQQNAYAAAPAYNAPVNQQLNANQVIPGQSYVLQQNKQQQSPSVQNDISTENMFCAECTKVATLRCKQCAKVAYCNTHCARIYWHRRHKAECKSMASGST